jgi:hypothetical protein
MEQQKLSLIRKYPLETLISVCIVAITTLWIKVINNETKVDNLNKEVKTYLSEDRKTLIEVVQENTSVMREIKEDLKNKK